MTERNQQFLRDLLIPLLVSACMGLMGGYVNSRDNKAELAQARKDRERIEQDSKDRDKSVVQRVNKLDAKMEGQAKAQKDRDSKIDRWMGQVDAKLDTLLKRAK